MHKSVRFAAFAAAMALAVGAHADGSDPEKFDGFYIGVNAGAGFASSDQTTSMVCSGAGGSCYVPAYITAINALGALHTDDSSSFTGGGYVGYNWQMDHVVLGLEVEYGVLDASTSSVVTATAPGPLAIASSVNADWLFTARPRIGFTSGHYLFYGTGGLAMTNVQANWSFANAPYSESASASKTKTGWALGLGVDASLSEHCRLGVEYLHLDFGSISGTGVVGAPASAPFSNVFSHDANLTDNVVRARLSYQF